MLSYIVSIIRGRSKPHRITRFVLLAVVLIATLSFHAAADTPTYILNTVLLGGNVVMFLLSLKYGMGGWAKSDIVCLTIAIIGIILWQISGNPFLSIYALVLADIAGMLPTVIKTYHSPQTEVWYFFFCDIAANIFILLAHPNITFNQYIYPGYLIVVNAIVVALILYPRKETFSK
jgi:hypothetical protein